MHHGFAEPSEAIFFSLTANFLFLQLLMAHFRALRNISRLTRFVLVGALSQGGLPPIIEPSTYTTFCRSLTTSLAIW